MLFRFAGAGVWILFAALLVTPQSAVAQTDMSNPSMRAVAANELAWEDAEVPGFLPGMQIAPVHGDPSVADQLYTLRLAFPDGYKFPPHWHPMAENISVMEGELRLAMGEEFDEGSLKTYRPGDYLFIEAENPHYGAANGRTVVQLHGMGPFEIQVVEGQEMSN